jgi:hypothetical protein
MVFLPENSPFARDPTISMLIRGTNPAMRYTGIVCHPSHFISQALTAGGVRWKIKTSPAAIRNHFDWKKSTTFGAEIQNHTP